MASPAKKPKQGTSATYSGFIRLCDAFVRGDSVVICPIGRTEESVRVLCRLQRDSLETLLKDCVKKCVGATTGLSLGPLEWFSEDSDQNNRNVFMRYDAEEELDEETFTRFKKLVQVELERRHNVKNTLLDKLPTKSTILQPIISESEFNLYKMKLCCEKLFQSPDSEEETNLSTALEIVKSQLEDLKENRITIGLLSHNGMGKSFFLNLLFLLTADTQDEYMNNNKGMKLPKDIQEDSTIEKLSDEVIQMLPLVIQDVIAEIRSDETNEHYKQHFKEFTEALLVKELGVPSEEDIQTSKKSLADLKNYFTGSKIWVNSYVLPQKELCESYDSTTKCVMHLRYGPLYQIKVEYFHADDLQYQLFELRSLIDGRSEGNGDISEERNDRSYECLKARLALLTDLSDDDDDDDEKKIQNVVQAWNSAEDVRLPEDVKAFAGTTELHIGKGESAMNDRLALKAVLKQLTSQGKDENTLQNFRKKLAAIKKVVVYLPAKILIGKEILEMPGIEPDPMAIHCIITALEKVDDLFLLSEDAFSICQKEVKEIFVDSKFLLNMLEDPENYKLMLLSYPEKQGIWNLKIISEKESQCDEAKKRKKEMKSLHKLIAKKKLLIKLNEDSVYISQILPVWYTSVYSQEGEPHDIIKKNNTLLKLTGITKLFIKLDTFAVKKQENSLQETIFQLQELEKGFTVENAEKIVSLLKKKDTKRMQDGLLAEENESLLIKLNKDLELILHEFVENEISDSFSSSIPDAIQKLYTVINSSTSIAIFNPFYNGNHPRFKVKIYDVLFEDFVGATKPLFTTLVTSLKEALETYQKGAIKKCVDKLMELIELMGPTLAPHESRRLFVDLTPQQKAIRDSTERFVEMVVNLSLKAPKEWYIGKKRLPFNEERLKKSLEESLKKCFRDGILKPAYQTNDISEAKEMVNSRISNFTEVMKKHFLKGLINSLHKKRFKSFTGKIQNKNGSWRTWQLLIGKVTQLTKDDHDFQNGLLETAIRLMSTSLYDGPQLQST